MIFANAIDPFSSRGELAGDEIAPFSFSRGKGSNDLSRHIHDGDGVGPVADDNLIRVLGHKVNTVHVDVATRCRTTQGFEGVETLCCLAIPNFHGAVGGATGKQSSGKLISFMIYLRINPNRSLVVAVVCACHRTL